MNNNDTWLKFTQIDAHQELMIRYDAITSVEENVDIDGKPMTTIFAGGQRFDVTDDYRTVVSMIEKLIRGY